MKIRIEVLTHKLREGVGKKSGEKYSMVVIDAIGVFDDEDNPGKTKRSSFEMVLPKDHPSVKNDTLYDAEVVVWVNYQNHLDLRVVQLYPVLTAKV